MFSQRIADPNFANVSLLLHMEGADTGTTFTDSSSNNFSVSKIGSVTTSTQHSKFGNTSGWFNGGYLTISSNAAFGPGTGDFTIECWVRPTSTTLVGGLINLGRYDNGLLWRVGSDSDSLYFNGNFTNWNAFTNAPVDDWTHIALVRSGSSVVVYADGVSVHTRTSSADLNSENAVVIGAGAHNNSELFYGYVDELRVTKGIARYTAAFTPPTAAFPDAARLGPP